MVESMIHCSQFASLRLQRGERLYLRKKRAKPCGFALFLILRRNSVPEHRFRHSACGGVFRLCG
ncbi:MAG: hypothetical protein U0M30_07775, partial [Agathobaculum butyriciproducens]